MSKSCSIAEETCSVCSSIKQTYPPAHSVLLWLVSHSSGVRNAWKKSCIFSARRQNFRLFSRQAGMPLIFMQHSCDKLYDTVTPCDTMWHHLKKESGTVFPAFLRVLKLMGCLPANRRLHKCEPRPVSRHQRDPTVMLVK